MFGLREERQEEAVLEFGSLFGWRRAGLTQHSGLLWQAGWGGAGGAGAGLDTQE